MGMAILLMVLAFLVVTLSVFAIINENPDGLFGIVLGIIVTCLSLRAAKDDGIGKILYGDLEKDAIYVTLSSAPADNGKYAVICRLQNGELHAYLLDQNPPKVFKATGGKLRPFQQFPEVEK